VRPRWSRPMSSALGALLSSPRLARRVPAVRSRLRSWGRQLRSSSSRWVLVGLPEFGGLALSRGDATLDKGITRPAGLARFCCSGACCREPGPQGLPVAGRDAGRGSQAVEDRSAPPALSRSGSRATPPIPASWRLERSTIRQLRHQSSPLRFLLNLSAAAHARRLPRPHTALREVPRAV
jgi:hypothetical protein